MTGVWFGFDQKRKIMNRGFAATVAVPAWARFMMKATEGAKPDWFKPTTDVVRAAVCRHSGLRAAESCKAASHEDGRPNVVDDYFLMGTEPYESCSGDHTAPSGFPEERAETPHEGIFTTVPSGVFLR